MSKLIPYIIAIVVIAVLWFLLKGCGNKPGPDHVNDKNQVDSIVQKAISDSVKWGIKRDSIFKIIAILQKGKDSLSGIINAYKVDIRAKGADIQDLIDELNASESAKDTLRTLSFCDSLKAQFETAKGLVSHYITANDSLAAENSHIITQNHTIIEHLSSMLTESNNQVFDISRRYGILTDDYNKINVKPKRWGIGPGIEVVYMSGVKVVPSVGIHYDLFKF